MGHVDANPAIVEAMLTQASYLRKPDAALDIARATLKLAAAEPSQDLAMRKKRFMHFYWGRTPAHIR